MFCKKCGTMVYPNEGDYKCPSCGHEGSFLVEVSENLLMFPDGTELSGDQGEQWGKASSCTCPTCSHLGVVLQFHAAKQNACDLQTGGATERIQQGALP